MSKTFDIVFVGILDKVKRIEILFKALYLLELEGIKHRVLIVGHGPEYSMLKNFSTRFKKTEIVFEGWVLDRTHKINCLNKSKIFVMCSKMEGLPIAMMEAMSCGIPVIVPNVGNINSTVRNLKNGILINNITPFSLSQNIRKVLSDNELYNKISLNARLTIKRNHSYEVATQKWKDILS